MKKFKLLFAADNRNKSAANAFKSLPLFAVAFCPAQKLEIISNFMLTQPDALVLCASESSQVADNVSALLRLSKQTEIFIMTLGKISLDFPLPDNFKLIDGRNCEAAAEELIFRSNFFDKPLESEPQQSEKSVEKAIDELGFTANYVGMLYVSDALSGLLSGEITALKGGFCKVVYPYIAKIRHVSAASVERSMRTAIAKSWERIDSDIKDKYFGMAFRGQTAPSNRAYILIVADKLRR